MDIFNLRMYSTNSKCAHSAESGKFIEFLLKVIYDALCELADTEQVPRLLEIIDDTEYSTKELLVLLGLRHRPTFRDNYLLPALKLGFIEMTIPDKPNNSKQKYKKTKSYIAGWHRNNLLKTEKV